MSPAFTAFYPTTVKALWQVWVYCSRYPGEYYLQRRYVVDKLLATGAIP